MVTSTCALAIVLQAGMGVRSVELVMGLDVDVVGPLAGPCFEPRDGSLGLKTFL